MNLKRMQLLRNFIAELPPQACNMNVWISPGNKDGEPVPLKTSRATGFECGIAGCLGGWCDVMVNHKASFYANDEDGVLKHAPIDAGEWLDLNWNEQTYLFYQYPIRTNGTWRDWMLRRLDGVLRDEEVRPWSVQMGKKRKPAKAQR